MQTNTFVSAILASLTVSMSHAAMIQENSLFSIGDTVKADHQDAWKAFMTSPLISLDESVTRRQDPPIDDTPNPFRPIVTPPFIFVLQCNLAGFRGRCLSLGSGITHAWVIPSGYPQDPWVITGIKLPIGLG
ncbi:hypothetical protein DHEL01_v202162 [Diaporthe helianthi]|uniref:Uncharacterized protein n=1 Tax=Diaporthe helianthi TaxID=158607 RepID=A0A2P5IAD1_DIAHE|nr:hypothetical protein DHEL01_v202162 [Diaporthe helianthi]